MFFNSLVFFPPKEKHPFTKEYINSKFNIDFNYHIFFLSCLPWKIPCFYIPNPNSKYLIILSHGNAVQLYDTIDTCIMLYKKLNVSVATYDYIGYGHSQYILNTKKSLSNNKNYPTEERCYKSIRTIYRYFLYKKKFNPNSIILLGESLGTGVSIELANTAKVGGVILISPFLSILRIPFTCNIFFFIDIFTNHNKIHNIKAPIKIIHGTHDEIINIKHSYILDKIIYNSKKNTPLYYKPTFIQKGTHNYLFDNFTNTMLVSISNFLINI